MAYIGHSASGNFTTKPSKDTFSGNGSTTAFTLSEGATTNTVDVFVENVRQEPTTAYTVDGTTLTFTAAPGSGTNNIYVVNRGPLQLSATHPAAQALEASTGTFTGDLTVDTNTLHVDTTNNRVGIGTASPSRLATLSANSGNSILELERANTNTTGATGAISFTASDTHSIAAIDVIGDGDNEGGHIRFLTTSAASANYYIDSTTERMRILSGGGLTFNGDTAAANALDDYEEGTWTPTAGTNVSAISANQGFYTKIGNVVTVHFVANLTPTSTGAAMTIGGLPYAVSDKASGTQVEATGVVFEDASLFLSIALGASSDISIEFDRPIQGSTPSGVEFYRGSMTYFTG